MTLRRRGPLLRRSLVLGWLTAHLAWSGTASAGPGRDSGWRADAAVMATVGGPSFGLPMLRAPILDMLPLDLAPQGLLVRSIDPLEGIWLALATRLKDLQDLRVETQLSQGLCLEFSVGEVSLARHRVLFDFTFRWETASLPKELDFLRTF